MKVYQIAVKGSYKLFNNSPPKQYFSPKVYKHYPTKEEINKFIKKCTTPIGECDIHYLNESDELEVEVKVLTVVD
jgi:hypothetical protein